MKKLSFFITLSFLTTVSVWTQTVIYSTNFGAAAVSGNVNLQSGWVGSGANVANLQLSTSSVSGTYSTPITASAGANLNDNGGTGAALVTVSGLVNTTGYSNIQVIWGARASSASYTGVVTFQYSIDNGANWVSASFTDITRNGSWAVINGGSWINIPNAGDISDLRFRFTFTRTTTSGNYRIDDFTVRGVASFPALSSSGTPGGFLTPQGTPSTAQTLIASGVNLTAPLVITAPTGFEVSSDGTNFANSVSLTPTSGVVLATNINVRLTGASAGQFLAGNVVFSSTGATSQSVNVQGITYATPTNFTPGNIVVLQAGSGALQANGTASPILIREFTTSGSYAQTIPIPFTDNGSNYGVTMSNSGTSEGALVLSGDNQRLTLSGYNSAVGTANVASSTSARVACVVYNNGTVNTSTRVTNLLGSNNVRGCVTQNGSGFWLSGASGGLVYAALGASTGVAVSSNNNTRVPMIIDGQLWHSSSVGLSKVGSGIPMTASTDAVILPVATVSDPYAFVFMDASTAVPGADLLYVANNTSLSKFSFNGTSWTARGTLTGTNITGVCGAWSSSTAILYISNATGLYSFVDNAAFDANITSSGTALTASANLIATPITNSFFRGVAFAPSATPTCTFYQDIDGDGYGNASVSQQFVCNSVQAGYIEQISGDCNDNNAAIKPGVSELPCNAVDDNCNGATDENFVSGCNDPLACNYSASATCATACDYTQQTYYQDNDGDGYGSFVSQQSCAIPLGYVLIGGDCSDANNVVNPGATENLCNGIDDNCNGTIDEGGVSGCMDINATNYNALATCNSGCTFVEFTAGNIVALRVGNGTGALVSTGTAVFLDELNTSGIVRSLAIPTTGTNRLVNSGTATSEGLLSRTQDGTKLTLAGYDATVGYASITSSTAALVPRVINTIGITPSSLTRAASSTTFHGGNNFRSACSDGNNHWGSGGATGIAYYGTGTPIVVSSTVTNARQLSVQNNKLYFSTGSGTSRGIYQVGTSTPPITSVTSAVVINMGATADPYAFQFSPNGNVCYIAENLTGVQKWVFNGTTWSLAYTFSMGTGLTARGLAVDFYSYATPRIYAVAVNATQTNIVYFHDNGSNNSTTVNTISSLTTATANKAYRGIAFAPCASSTWYADADGDGFGALANTLSYCTQPYGYVSNSTDCDDAVAASNPNATEICDGLDNDCNGAADNGLTFTNYYHDNDGDTYGAGLPTSACQSPGAGYVTNNTDCDDAQAAANPGAVEICDALDNDCNSSVDDGLTFTNYYHDNDGDTYGAGLATNACQSPGAGYVTNNTDCDDATAAVNPGAVEVCNAIDDDCVGGADNGLTFVNYYNDQDGDSYGAGAALNSCQSPGGAYVTVNGDCDDAAAAVYPTATEICNNIDDDCDGTADDGLTFVNYYNDQDGDTYGAGTAINACQSPGASYVTNNTDCDDAAVNTHPSAAEICNAIDDDCDGTADDGLTFVNYYNDGDGDGYGAGAVTNACQSPGATYVTNNTDCNDGNSAINPGATDICNNTIDEDCSGADCVSGINAAVLINNIGQYGTGIQATQAVNLSLGTNTIESPGVGNDVWYKFVAQNNAIRVALTGSTTAADDNDLGLYNNPSTIGVQMIPISTENDVHPTALGVSTDGGNEIMYYSNLVSGNTYYLLVRNNNANPGTCTLTISYLKGSQAEVGPYTGGTGIYNTTCQSFKGAFRPNGTNYTVNRWADVTATGAPVWTYVIPSNSTICQLGKILPPNMSGSQVSYPVTVDVTYNLPDAFGNMNTINARGNVVTSVMLNSEASLFVRTTDACPVFKSPTTGTVATNRSVCGIDRYEWQFTEANAQGVATGLPNLTPIYGAAGASRLLTLVSVPGMAGAKFYNVKIRTKHTDGVSLSSWGNTSCVKTIGAAGMVVENNEAIGQTLSNGADVLIFPNPNNGQGVNLQIRGMDGDVMVRVTDANGRSVHMERYIVEGALNTTLHFNQALSSGLYQVEFINGNNRTTLRMSVVR